ncbi:carbohydrate kinase [Saccharopolyspora erythraea]|uniref:FGGY-family carbohydrate kinase n=1 Tax=Saccharopolyspora erythraea TaxID=1836 RepID=UPI001BAA301D|nr:FGGY-family carbohydrate kinase [Saccharopolyspora erythraea]QUH04922.1 carbohydrate kinase [Saccharopolyspora erythraea]
MITIGIDAGTSVVKAVAYADDGVELAVVRRPTRVVHPEPGWAEQDMDEVWEAVATTVAELVSAVGQDVRAVAVTAQGDGCWLVDADGRPVGPAMLWNDARAAGTAAGWARSGILDELFEINGSVGFAGLPHAQLTWLAEHAPGRLASASKVLTCGGWLYRCLTGRLAQDVSEASNPFLDARSGEYSDAVLTKLGLDWARKLLPEVVDGEQRVAPLTEAAGRRLGVPAGTPVVLAAYDVISTAIGAGTTKPGQACTILGTTVCTEVLSDSPRLERSPVGMSLRTPMPQRWMLAYATLAGTEVVEWTCRMLGLPNPENLTALAENAEPGSEGLLMLPYLSPGGERAPFYDPRARGSLHGLSLEHGPAEIARACLEGLALVIRECLDASTATPTELRLTGGGSANPLWRQVIADATGLPVVRTSDAQAGARGATVTAHAVLEGRTIPEVAADLVGTSDPVDPLPANRPRYDDAYTRFLAARNAARTAHWFRPAD